MLPRFGAATVLALNVVGQMLGSLTFDHFWPARHSATFGESGTACGGGLSHPGRRSDPLLKRGLLRCDLPDGLFGDEVSCGKLKQQGDRADATSWRNSEPARMSVDMRCRDRPASRSP